MIRGVLVFILLVGCTTTQFEIMGECYTRSWSFGGINLRRSIVCDLPPPVWPEPPIDEVPTLPLDPFEELHHDGTGVH